MDKTLIEAFIAECKQEQEWKERWEANHIDFNNYFKYSGEVEPTQVLISHFGSTKKVFNAKREDVVRLVGETKTRLIFK